MRGNSKKTCGNTEGKEKTGFDEEQGVGSHLVWFCLVQYSKDG
jgi:hypothetical protein